MRLGKIKISGYKSYGWMSDPVELGKLNLIIGPNGSGKSNFISFLEMISFIAADGFESFVARNGYAASLLHSRLDRMDHIEGKLVFEDDRFCDEYEVEINQGSGGELYISKERIRYQDSTHTEPYERIYKSIGRKSALIEESITNQTARTLLSIIRGCRIFHFNDTSLKSRIRMPGYTQDNRFLRADGGNLAAFLLGMKKSEEYNKYYFRIEDMIREVFPRFAGFSLHAHYEEEGGGENILLNWKEKGCDAIFGPHQFSDGTLRYIALCSLLMAPKKLRPEVIILDEPEIGLHPYAVRVVCEMIRMASSDSQIIIATQSKDLLNEFSAADIIVAEFDDVRESSTLKRLDIDELAEWLDEYSLAELWDKNVIGGTP